MYPEIFVSANFFMRIQKYLRPHVAYTNRIRPSTRIRFVSGHLKGLVNSSGRKNVLRNASAHPLSQAQGGLFCVLTRADKGPWC